MTLIEDPAELCLKYIYETNCNVFLTGKAGTGKTSLLKRIISESPKKAVVVAPTGIAALNAGGVTIHSMFHLPFGTFIPDFGSRNPMVGNVKLENRNSLAKHFNYNKTKRSLLRELELLIIDEVSMLRADVLDAIDWALRNVRNNNVAFGGVQVLFIGDLLQLPPVCKSEDWSYLNTYYKGIFFFNALVLQNNQPIYIELEKIYRQADNDFISILNELRNNRLSDNNLAILNKHYVTDEEIDKEKNYIILTTHNEKANRMNTAELSHLQSKSFTYKALVNGNFPENIYPNEEKLSLKVGSQVMFIKNDTSFEKRYYNGKIGVVKYLDDNEISVFLPEDNKIIKVEQNEWENVSYTLNKSTNEIEEKVLGTFLQYPLKLAWAITIHKSQGLTFKHAILDVQDVFASGQAYVALSRLQALDGLILKSPFRKDGVENDRNVVLFADNKQSVEQLNNDFSDARINYLRIRLQTTFQWNELEEGWRKHIGFYKSSGDKSERIKHYDWATEQFEKVKELIDVANKFIVQLERLFHQEPIDFAYLKERFDKAYHHFIEPLDQLNVEVLRKRFVLAKLKRVKEFQEELEILDEIQMRIFFGLKRTNRLLKLMISGEIPTKGKLETDDIEAYRKEKYLSIQKEFEKNKTTLQMDEQDDFSEIVNTLEKAKVKKKKQKIPTQYVTLEMFHKGMSVNEIADERMMVASTIYSHLAKLVEEKEIQAEEILSAKLMTYFTKHADKNDIELSLSELKGRFTKKEIGFNEIKIYRASLIAKLK